MKVILIGYRASGKTTVGKVLAAKLRVPFWDADLLLEKSAGMMIKDIVAYHGWDFFRTREKEVIEKLAQKRIGVIATGGGVVLDPANIELLRRAGIMIWLNTPLQDIITRLQEDARTAAFRPQFTKKDLVQESTEVWEKRFPLYKKAADFSLDTAGKKSLQVADEIYQYLLKSGALAQVEAKGNRSSKQSLLTGD